MQQFLLQEHGKKTKKNENPKQETNRRKTQMNLEVRVMEKY